MAKQKGTIQYEGAREGDVEEKMYFAHIEKIINRMDESKFNVKFKLATSHGGDPKEVVRTAIRSLRFSSPKQIIKERRLIAVFDHDGKDEKFKEAINLAKKEKVICAYSNFSFGLWIILHKEYETPTVTNSDDYYEKIKRIYNLQSIEGSIKTEDNFKKVIEQITIEDVKRAIHNAQRLRKNRIENGNVLYREENGEIHYEQPYVEIDKFIEEILIKCNIN